MRLLRLPPSPESRRLHLVLIGTGCAVPLAASAMGTSSPRASPGRAAGAYIPDRLLPASRSNPSHDFRGTISGASAAVTGRPLLQLGAAKGVAAITLDRPIRLLDEGE